MKTPNNPYSDKEAEIDARAQRAMEALARDGEFLPFSTHRELAEFALLLEEVREMEKKIKEILERGSNNEHRDHELGMDTLSHQRE